MTNTQHLSLGDGYLERIWQQELMGQISEDQAISLARSTEVAESLTQDYVLSVCIMVERLVYEDWASAIMLHRLLLSALEFVQDSTESREMWRDALLSWIQTVTLVVNKVPDGRLFRSAVAAGNRLMTAPLYDASIESLVLFRLGALHLDPYTAGRSSLNFQQQILHWKQTLTDYYGDKLVGVSQEELAVPDIAAALETAVQYLRRAAELSTDVLRGRSLKALGQALIWSMQIGKNIDKTELINCFENALTYFTPATNPAECAAILSSFSSLGHKPSNAIIEPLLKVPISDYYQRLGAEDFVNLVINLALIQMDSPEKSLALICELEPFIGVATDNQKLTIWRLHINLMHLLLSLNRSIHSRARPLNQIFELLRNIVHQFLNLNKNSYSESKPTNQNAQLLRQQSTQEAWSREKLAGGLIALAIESSSSNEEEEGLKLLEEASQLCPDLFLRHNSALRFLDSSLTMNCAVNYLSNNHARAVEFYGRALNNFLRLSLDETALDCLKRLEDVGNRSDQNDTVPSLLSVLLIIRVACEACLGEKASRIIRAITNVQIRKIAQGLEKPGVVDPSIMLLALVVAKGYRFGASMYSWKRYTLGEDPKGKAKLEQVAAMLKEAPMEQQPSGEREVRDEPFLNDAMLLCAYINPEEQEPGVDSVEVLENSRRIFDRHVDQKLAMQANNSWETVDRIQMLHMLGKIPEMLGDRTVLVNFYQTATPEGQTGHYILAYTRVDVYGALGGNNENIPVEYVILGDGKGPKIKITSFGLEVQKLLKYITTPPWIGNVSPDAATALERDAQVYLGPLRDFLDAQKAAGKDHLCFVPHGPLHYYPLHLLGHPERPLADEWIVTYLPNINLLRRMEKEKREETEHVSISTMTAIGLEFAEGNPHNLPPILGAGLEATEIAKLFEVAPLRDSDATKEVVTKALQRSQYVHIASHGEHCVSAPAFQRIYLSSDDQTDGSLYAYEILALDLRGLEILTLSACETALGRFDANDNLSGLPASFFSAGVSTIIGTLWPVETNASQLFFTKFYRELRQGTDRLDAFAAAQRFTRQTFPQYRDWGAFYMAGAWQ